MNPVLGDLHRRTHRTTGIKVEAYTVAVTLHRTAPLLAYRNGDLPIECTALHRVHFHHRRIETFWRANLPWVESVMRVKCRFHFAQFCKKFQIGRASCRERV